MDTFTLVTVYILSGVIGLCVGSFLNVVIYRVPEGMSLSKPNSHCPKCGYELRWYDNIPLFSYLFLGGKCRSCRDRISFRYPAVELANMLLWLLSVYLFIGESYVYTAIAALLSSIFLCIFFIDLDHMLIFDRFVIMVAALGVVAIFFDTSTVWYDHLIGLGAASLVFLGLFYGSLWILKREGLGGGDVKLAMAAGLLLGWQKFLLGMVVASLVGSLVLLALRIFRKDEKQKEYPFAPFLVLGFAVAMFVGAPLIDLYLSLLLG